jgi:hypothetical protein
LISHRLSHARSVSVPNDAIESENWNTIEESSLSALHSVNKISRLEDLGWLRFSVKKWPVE